MTAQMIYKELILWHGQKETITVLSPIPDKKGEPMTANIASGDLISV